MRALHPPRTEQEHPDAHRCPPAARGHAAARRPHPRQAAIAGQFLAGDAAWVRVHETNAGIIHLVALAQLVLAILVWRRGPGWPALASLALLLAEELQMGFGYARMLALHVPLGVAIFGLTVAMLVGTRRLTRVDAPPEQAAHAPPVRPGAVSGPDRPSRGSGW
jgi:hypothetical protein